jgi:hypothetical protein
LQPLWASHYEIKAESNTPGKSRKTLAKQIIALVKDGEYLEAEQIAEYGRKLLYHEAFIRLYYKSLDEWGAAMKGKKTLSPIWQGEADISPEEFQATHKKLREAEAMISQMFIDAVNRHDREAVLELANAVWFFRDKRYPNFIPADPERSQLLVLKQLMRVAEGKLTIRQVAQFLALKNTPLGQKIKIQSTEDGFSALRRKCKQLGIPLAESRKTSRK